jgi:hypothetical protein
MEHGLERAELVMLTLSVLFLLTLVALRWNP